MRTKGLETRSSAVLAGDLVALKAADGVAIRAFFRSAPADAPQPATVFVLQGRAEFLEKYAELFDDLHARGFAVAALDWRGQGGSERQVANPRKGHVEDFDDYLLDLRALVDEARRRGLPSPHYLLAHSTGGLIGLLALDAGIGPFERLVASAPLTGIAGLEWPRAARLLARLLVSLGLSTFYRPGGSGRALADEPVEGNVLTGDPARYARAAELARLRPELTIGDPTIGWVDSAFAAMDRLESTDFGAASRTPSLFLVAGNDRVVDSRATERLASRLRGASAIVLAGSRHEILMERDAIRAAFWKAFDAFVPPRERLPAEPPPPTKVPRKRTTKKPDQTPAKPAARRRRARS